MANRTATFETSKGRFKVEPFEEKTPITTGNFIKLAEGAEVVRSIGSIETNPNDRPLEDVTVHSVTIGE